MQRRSWFEFHDHRLFPGFLRDLVTDALGSMWSTRDVYGPIVPRLERALTESRATRVLDLCSGGGGPWLRLSCDLKGNGGIRPEILLTDKYPSRGSIRQIERAAESGISFYPEPLDAMAIPPELTGFRTMFSTFHHFGPQEAREILKNAFEQSQGVGIFEAAKCAPRTLAAVTIVPLLALRLAPQIRPFRWTRIFWTYCLPVIPLTLFVDGLLSCLRSYSQADLRELTSGLTSESYHWEIGEEKTGPITITYLVGYPSRSAQAANAIAAESLELQMQRPAG